MINFTKQKRLFDPFIRIIILVTLLAVMFSACSAESQPKRTELPPYDGAVFQFEEGKHQRGENCSMIFDFQTTSYGQLTLIISDNLVEPVDKQELAAKVVNLYIDLVNESPVPMDKPITVTLLTNPDVGECYSTGNLVFLSPDELDSESAAEELLGAATGISEYWMLVGLTSLTRSEQPDNDTLKTWYQATDDLDMAGLFIARFNENWATEEEIRIARMSATSLLQYALEVEKIQPEKLEEQINNEVRSRWLESLGVERIVEYPYDGYFSGFQYSIKRDCQLYVTTDNMYFCLNRIPEQKYFDEISEAEFFIYDAYYGRKALAEYLMTEAPSISHLMNPEEEVTFKVHDLSGFVASTTGNTMSLNKSGVYYDILHELVHTFEWNSILNKENTLWLSEGFADYLGTLLTIYPQTTKRCVYEELTGPLNTVDSGVPGTSYWYFLDPEQFAAAKAWYIAQGGRMDSEDSVDPRLYADAVSFATIYRNTHFGTRGITIGEKYDLLVPGFHNEGQDGVELSYTQAAAFVGWLCDTYTIDRVLDVYVNHTEDGLLDGKTYSELKAAWQATLLQKGQGIEPPDEP